MRPEHSPTPPAAYPQPSSYPLAPEYPQPQAISPPSGQPPSNQPTPNQPTPNQPTPNRPGGRARLARAARRVMVGWLLLNIFVYGLILSPAILSRPETPTRRLPWIARYPLALLLPFVCSILPVALLVGLRGRYPGVFPPRKFIA